MIHFKVLQNFQQIDMGKAQKAPRVGDVIITNKGTYRVTQRAFDLRADHTGGFCIEVETIGAGV
ncbi:hypothetical protein [Maritalea sp.]|jgi:hypothetical protein|uniref:hypothetical protein n=1 Tax=Maritalea sp. TaxID=2003361 RepID=UPI0039E65DE3